MNLPKTNFKIKQNILVLFKAQAHCFRVLSHVQYLMTQGCFRIMELVHSLRTDTHVYLLPLATCFLMYSVIPLENIFHVFHAFSLVETRTDTGCKTENDCLTILLRAGHWPCSVAAAPGPRRGGWGPVCAAQRIWAPGPGPRAARDGHQGRDSHVGKPGSHPLRKRRRK